MTEETRFPGLIHRLEKLEADVEEFMQHVQEMCSAWGMSMFPNEMHIAELVTSFAKNRPESDSWRARRRSERLIASLRRGRITTVGDLRMVIALWGRPEANNPRDYWREQGLYKKAVGHLRDIVESHNL